MTRVTVPTQSNMPEARLAPPNLLGEYLVRRRDGRKFSFLLNLEPWAAAAYAAVDYTDPT